MKKLLCLLLTSHKFSEWEIFTWSFELRAGGEIRVCGICGEEERQPIHLRPPSPGEIRGLIPLPPFGQVGAAGPNHNKRP